jgi:hypothetical protein
MAGAAGSAAIAARGISVVKEIVIATGLGLAAGGVFKVRPCAPAPLATVAAQRRGARTLLPVSRRAAGGAALATTVRERARGNPNLRQWCAHALVRRCRRVTDVALERPSQGGAVLRGPEQGGEVSVTARTQHDALRCATLGRARESRGVRGSPDGARPLAIPIFVITSFAASSTCTLRAVARRALLPPLRTR